jgi:hypothetical protein
MGGSYLSVYGTICSGMARSSAGCQHWSRNMDTSKEDPRAIVLACVQRATREPGEPDTESLLTTWNTGLSFLQVLGGSCSLHGILEADLFFSISLSLMMSWIDPPNLVTSVHGFASARSMSSIFKLENGASPEQKADLRDWVPTTDGVCVMYSNSIR